MTLLNQLAAQLNVEGPVTNRLFVASLDYKVDESKIREVFALAGAVTCVSLFRDRENKSRGMAVVEYDTPFEALNAVSMFHKQQLMDRQMTVRFDAKPPELGDLANELAKQQPAVMAPPKLPSGLKSIGSGLNLGSMTSSSSAPSLSSSYGNGLISTPAEYSSYNTSSSSGSGGYSNGGGTSSSLLGNGSSTSNGYSNGHSSKNSSSSNGGGGGGGDIRIVSSGSNGSLSISNRISGYSSSGNSNSASYASSHGYEGSSSSSSSSYSHLNRSNNYGSSSSMVAKSGAYPANTKVFIKNVS